MRKYIAECIGTMVLTLLGCGTAMFLGCNTAAGVVGTAVAFGLSVVAMAYTIGGISATSTLPVPSDRLSSPAARPSRISGYSS